MSIRAGKCHIRMAREDDYQSLEGIYLAHEGDQIPVGYFHEFTKTIRSNDVIYFVAEVEGEIIGGGGLSDVMRGAQAVLVFGLVAPTKCGRGYGTALLLARFIFLGAGLDGAQVTLEATEKSVAFFTKLGFQWYGKDWDEAGNDFFSGSHMIYPGDEKIFTKILNEGGVTLDFLREA